MQHSLLYQLFRYSKLYTIYLRLFRKEIFEERKVEFHFYKQLDIPKKSLILDVGANIGDKSYMFSRLVKRVVAIEPDQQNYRLLKARFFLNNRVEVTNVAVGEENGKAKFYVTSSGSPANTLSSKWKNILENPEKNRWSKSLTFDTSYEVEVVTLDDLIRIYGKPYYIKIDVEGFELQALKGLTGMVPLISLEANFPEFKEETIACIQVMKSLSPKTMFNCIDPKHTFFWSDNKTGDEMINWLESTSLKYFEVFALS